jgi:hypothetical protein
MSKWSAISEYARSMTGRRLQHIVQIAEGELTSFHRCGDLLGLHARVLQSCHRSHPVDVARAKRLSARRRREDPELHQTLHSLHSRTRSLGQLLQRETPRAGRYRRRVAGCHRSAHGEPSRIAS